MPEQLRSIALGYMSSRSRIQSPRLQVHMRQFIIIFQTAREESLTYLRLLLLLLLLNASNIQTRHFGARCRPQGRVVRIAIKAHYRSGRDPFPASKNLVWGQWRVDF